MAKQIVRDGPIHTAVLEWMREHGINPDNVRGYTLQRQAAGDMWIDVSMWMNDVKPKEAEQVEFIVDGMGTRWVYDHPREGYVVPFINITYQHGRSREEITEAYGFPNQPLHITCTDVTGIEGRALARVYMCTAECPKSPPKRIQDSHGDVFVRVDNGGYMLERGSGVNEYTFEEIERDYGPIKVIDA